MSEDLTIKAPTTPGWYRYNGGANVFVFLLDRRGQWWASMDNGDHTRCDWGYIEQALGVFNLVLIAALPSIEEDRTRAAVLRVLQRYPHTFGRDIAKAIENGAEL